MLRAPRYHRGASRPNKPMHPTADTRDFKVLRGAGRRVMGGVRHLHSPKLRGCMGRYDNIRRILNSAGVGSRLTPISEAEVISIRAQYPSVPEDYLDYLREVGYGDVGGGSYMIYSGLLQSDEIYDPETAEDLSRVAFFGDDFGGQCAGFDTSKNWVVVEVESIDNSLSEMSKTFEEFITGTIRARYGAV